MLHNKLNAALLGFGFSCVVLLLLFKIHESSTLWASSCSESDNAALLKKLSQLESHITALPQNFKALTNQNQADNTAKAKYERLEAEYAVWVKSYTAPNPRHQDFCMKFLTQQGDGNGQFVQDIFVFHNLFKYWPMQGRKGFYVDSGINDAVVHSNTYFFDVCLGWAGLCVEPNEIYHHGIKTERTCTLIPECISNQETTVLFEKNSGAGKVLGAGGSTQCTTLERMLKRSVNPNQKVVDFWSLDVEGHEITILSSVDFKRTQVLALLVEDFWINSRDLNYLMYKNNYKMLQPLGIDSLFTPRDLEEPFEFWYPTRFFEHIEFHQEYRKRNNLPYPLVCA
jgi:hypothetical protein